VSYFEWAQNLSGVYWTKAEVFSKLRHVMTTSFNDVWAAAEKYKVDLRTGAYVVALKRVEDAMKARGLVK